MNRSSYSSASSVKWGYLAIKWAPKVFGGLKIQPWGCIVQGQCGWIRVSEESFSHVPKRAWTYSDCDPNPSSSCTSVPAPWPGPLSLCLDYRSGSSLPPRLVPTPPSTHARTYTVPSCSQRGVYQSLSPTMSLFCPEPSMAPTSGRGKATDPIKPSKICTLMPPWPHLLTGPLTLQMHRPPHCSSGTQGMVLPQGLCTR